MSASSCIRRTQPFRIWKSKATSLRSSHITENVKEFNGLFVHFILIPPSGLYDAHYFASKKISYRSSTLLLKLWTHTNARDECLFSKTLLKVYAKAWFQKRTTVQVKVCADQSAYSIVLSQAQHANADLNSCPVSKHPLYHKLHRSINYSKPL